MLMRRKMKEMEVNREREKEREREGWVKKKKKYGIEERKSLKNDGDTERKRVRIFFPV